MSRLLISDNLSFQSPEAFVCELQKLFNMLQLLSDVYAVATGAEVSVENILLKSKSYASFVLFFFSQRHFMAVSFYAAFSLNRIESVLLHTLQSGSSPV